MTIITNEITHQQEVELMGTVMGSVPNFLELRSVSFQTQNLDLVLFPFQFFFFGTSSVPFPVPFL